MITQIFNDTFGYSPAISGFTPGRVNLIGEHTDYNGGMVLPTALPQGVSIALSPRDDAIIRIASGSFDGIAERHLNDEATKDWSDYVTGAIISAYEAGFIKGGADVAITTTLPFGAGLSSSAAVTVGVLKLCRDHAGKNTSDKDIAVMARKIENDFIGMPCGIMDQIAVAIAHPGQALAIDTRTLDYKLIDLPTDYRMAVIHSGYFRELSEGRYAERKEECDLAKSVIGHEDICLATPEELEKLSDQPENIQRRARHCVTEQQRTMDAVKAIQNKDMAAFGQILIEGHASIRDDFEITLPGIDRLVQDAVKFGALGARQTGGGFGGCIIACVAEDTYENWIKALLGAHPKAFDVLEVKQA